MADPDDNKQDSHFMIKQVIVPLAAVMLFIIVVGLFSKNPSGLNLVTLKGSSAPVPLKTLTVESKEIQVEIANTDKLRTKGLSARNTMPQDSGMLFVFDSKKITPSFWMKDMLIPLDFIWIADGKVVKIDEKVPAPAPKTPDNKLFIYNPGKPIDYVLEVNSGFAQKNGVKVGSEVVLPDL